jgi:hypothetical protein
MIRDRGSGVGTCVLPTGHDDNLVRLVLRPFARVTAAYNLADDAAEEVAVRPDDAPAAQRLLLALGHDAYCTGGRTCSSGGGVSGYTDTMADDDPTVLWRMTRGRSSAHATIIPGPSQTTITWFFDGVMDRVENYDSVGLALARADDIKGVLLRDGWTEA